MVRALFIVAAALLLTSCGSSKNDETLSGTVGPGFVITLKKPDGALVTKLAPGRYKVTVDDKSAFLNFHLTGPGVDEETTVPGTGTTTWTVIFEGGTYTYTCDPHASIMRGSFTVS